MFFFPKPAETVKYETNAGLLVSNSSVRDRKPAAQLTHSLQCKQGVILFTLLKFISEPNGNKSESQLPEKK